MVERAAVVAVCPRPARSTTDRPPTGGLQRQRFGRCCVGAEAEAKRAEEAVEEEAEEAGEEAPPPLWPIAAPGRNKEEG